MERPEVSPCARWSGSIRSCQPKPNTQCGAQLRNFAQGCRVQQVRRFHAMPCPGNISGVSHISLWGRTCKSQRICPVIEMQSSSRARAWRNGIRSGLKENLSARLRNRRCRTAQIRGNLKWQFRAKPGDTNREGVETRRAEPKVRSFRRRVKGWSRPQTNVSSARASRPGGESRRRYENPQDLNGPWGSSPSARTKFLLRPYK